MPFERTSRNIGLIGQNLQRMVDDAGRARAQAQDAENFQKFTQNFYDLLIPQANPEELTPEAVEPQSPGLLDYDARGPCT